MERWDILNYKGEKTGRTAVRGNTVLKRGEYHLVVHIWIVSTNGNFLIQRRSDKKKLMPGEWAATGGAAVAGEDSFTAASRELSEELGIKSDKSSLKFVRRLRRRNSFVDVYIIRTDIPVSELTLQKSEVQTAKWVSPDILSQMIENGEFHNYGKYYWPVIFGLAGKEKNYEFKD